MWSVKGGQNWLYRLPPRVYFRGADGCLLLFDVTRRQTLSDEAAAILEEWEKVDGISLNKQPPNNDRRSNDTNIKATPPVILVGTKVIVYQVCSAVYV